MTTYLPLIQSLRAETGAGVMQCRQALENAQHDYQQALAHLRQAASLQAQKQAARQALYGRIELYSHNNGRIGVMLELNTETEFAARSALIARLAHDLALHVTSAAPLYVRDEDVPQPVLDELARTAAQAAYGKPPQVAAQIAAGQLARFQAAKVLLHQPYLLDETLTVAQVLAQAAAQCGENIVLRRFTRWEIVPEAIEP